jgi:probable selenium-dependent hydroxylase accessory protein YqeC
VIPGNTTLLVPVVGIEALGRPLDEETVFRSAIASRLLDLPIGSVIAEEAIARLMLELIKSGPAGARVVPLVNKVDIPGGRGKAEKLARHLLSLNQPAIQRVVIGRLQGTPAVEAVLPG